MTTSLGSFHRDGVVPEFTNHAFGAYCFNAIGCSVIYANRYQLNDESDEVSGPMPADLFYRMKGSQIGIGNFPSPAIVSWRSLDGVKHKAEIDIAHIFKNEQIVHGVEDGDIPEGALIPNPDIVLTVDDRTISVYMFSFIPLKNLKNPSNKYSGFSRESFLAYKHIY